MHDTAGQSVSVWMQTASTPALRPLTQDTSTDVCVVGAGIAGMSAAYLLTQAGKSVVVLDDGPIGGGQTERTTAHLANAIDDRNMEMVRLHGDKGARLAAESHMAAINRIEMIVAKEQMDCDFERLDGYLFLGPGESADTLDKELEATRRAGMTEVERVARAPISSFDTGPCLRFPRQGQFHPLKYLNGLARAIQRDGGRIFTGTHATKIVGGDNAHVETKGGQVVRAESIIVATNTPVNDLVAIHTKQAPYMTYVIGGRVPAGAVPTALYWDSEDPYHYIRLQKGAAPSAGGGTADDVLIVGGEDHKTGQADDLEERYGRLEAWTRERFPMMAEVLYRWSGQVMETVDGLAFIGRNPLDKPNVYIATGDSGMGMTHGTIAGILLTDLIMERENAWATLYDPSRVRVSAAGEFTKENLNVAARYTEWLTGGDIKSAEDLAPGSGGVMRRGLHKVALYRDDQGTLHELSATCPHLGCIVHWNGNEKTWDCPCHGSRFDAYGEVLNGPANTGLK